MSFKDFLKEVSIRSVSVEVKEWLKKIINLLEDISYHRDKTALLELEKMLKGIPMELIPFLELKNVNLYRVIRIGSESLKSFIDGDNELSFLEYNPTSFFKTKNINEIENVAEKLIISGAGFIEFDDYNDELRDNLGYGIVYKLPKNYIKTILPFDFLFKLLKMYLDKEDEYLQFKQLFEKKINMEKEVLVYLSSQRIKISKKDVIFYVDNTSKGYPSLFDKGKDMYIYLNSYKYK